ncbi:MAG: DUF4089 domain-containing protein [Rhodospirillales bacterium]
MPATPFDAAAYVDLVAPLMGLDLDPAHRPGVVENLALIARLADAVATFPLPDDVEAGPIFTP